MSSGYRPPSREPRGRWARHIHAVRRRENWSATVAFEKLVAAGYPLALKSRSAYLPVDEGKREPRPDEEAALVKVFGYPPETAQEPLEPTGTPDLAAAINALVGELQAMRQERESVEARLRALEAEVQSLRAPREGEASGAQHAPQVTAGS